MNNTQRKYLLERINKIEEEAIKRFKADMVDTKRGWTTQEVVDGIVSGAFPPIPQSPDCYYDRYTYLKYTFNIPDKVPAKEDIRWNKAMELRIQRVKEAANVARDKAMLGGNYNEIVSVIEELENATQ